MVGRPSGQQMSGLDIAGSSDAGGKRLVLIAYGCVNKYHVEGIGSLCFMLRGMWCGCG